MSLLPGPPPSPAADAAAQGALQRLARWVADDVADDLRRAEERATSEARRVLAEAEERAAELRAAARRLGGARGAAVRASAEAAGRAEAEGVAARAFEALRGRFLTRVRLGLEALAGTPAHARALAAWARAAAARSTGPAEVFVEAALRPAVFEALLAAGVRDVRVHADPRVRVGFVLRDLDGRTLLDVQPAALVADQQEALTQLLQKRCPPRP